MVTFFSYQQPYTWTVTSSIISQKDEEDKQGPKASLTSSFSPWPGHCYFCLGHSTEARIYAVLPWAALCTSLRAQIWVSMMLLSLLSCSRDSRVRAPHSPTRAGGLKNVLCKICTSWKVTQGFSLQPGMGIGEYFSLSDERQSCTLNQCKMVLRE